MAGHSKWANIKHRKAAQDAKRGKIFTKMIREITVSARLGGGEIADNPRLRAAVDKALGVNMTKDTIERAIARGVGGADGADLEELTYEGYAPGGVAVLVEAMTDNRNRTVAEVRHAFSKFGGNLGTDGSVAYLFEKKGVINLSSEADENRVIETALNEGAEDIITNDDGGFDIYTTQESYESTLVTLKNTKFPIESAEVSLVPSTSVSLDLETAEKVLCLVDRLEELDDVQNVYTNADISMEIMEKIAASE